METASMRSSTKTTWGTKKETERRAKESWCRSKFVHTPVVVSAPREQSSKGHYVSALACPEAPRRHLFRAPGPLLPLVMDISAHDYDLQYTALCKQKDIIRAVS